MQPPMVMTTVTCTPSTFDCDDTDATINPKPPKSTTMVSIKTATECPADWDMDSDAIAGLDCDGDGVADASCDWMAMVSMTTLLE